MTKVTLVGVVLDDLAAQGLCKIEGFESYPFDILMGKEVSDGWLGLWTRVMREYISHFGPEEMTPEPVRWVVERCFSSSLLVLPKTNSVAGHPARGCHHIYDLSLRQTRPVARSQTCMGAVLKDSHTYTGYRAAGRTAT